MKHNMPDLVLAAFTERDSWYYLPFCCNPQLLVNNRSKKADPPENANIPSRSHCSNKYVNAPRKQRQPKTRPAEAPVRGGIHLIISSVETNRSFELQILSFSSESLIGLNRVILLALAAHLPTWTFGDQNRKILQRHKQAGNKTRQRKYPQKLRHNNRSKTTSP
jgi:hypothetical protein